MSILLNPLNAILCVCQGIAMSMLAVGEMLINGLVVSLGGWIDALALLLPSMPAVSGPPDAAVLQWIMWAFPLGSAVAVLSSLIALWLAFGGVRIALRWARAL